MAKIYLDTHKAQAAQYLIEKLQEELTLTKDLYRHETQCIQQFQDEIERLRGVIAEKDRVIRKYRDALEYVASHHAAIWHEPSKRIAAKALYCMCDEHGTCAWCYAGRKTYFCPVCGEIPNYSGVITHKNIPHPESMTFDEQENP